MPLTMLAACTPEPQAPVQSPLDRMRSSSRTALCEGVLAEALAEVRRPGYEWDRRELEQAMRWSYSHAHDDCGGGVSGRALWRETIAAWGRIGGDEAGSALVASMRVSRNLAADYDRREQHYEQETALALDALASIAPVGVEVVHELLRWYDRGAADCALEGYRDQIVGIVSAAGLEGAFALSEYFPPPREDGRCATGWMLSQVLEGMSADDAQRVIGEIDLEAAFENDLGRLLEVVDATSGVLQGALSSRACDLSVIRAQELFHAEDADPRDAVSDTFAACAAVEGGPERIVALQRRLTRWLVREGMPEQALETIESLPAEDVDDEWFAEVGVAVLRARRQAHQLLPAMELWQALVDRLGEAHEDLAVLREPMRADLIDAAWQLVEEPNIPEARALLVAAIRAFGEDEQSRRLAIILAFTEIRQVTSTGECPSAEEIERLGNALTTGRDMQREYFRDEADLADAYREANRAWRPFVRRCRRRR